MSSPLPSAANPEFAGAQVLVTGAGGFIGSHLCESLVRAGANVRALIRYSSHGSIGNLAFLPPDILSQIEIVAGNIEDSESLQRMFENCTAVFHLAALIGIPYSYHAPRSYLRSNIEGTFNVLEAARRAQIQRLVITSTSEVYGSAQRVPIDETHPLQGQSPYSASKIAAEKLTESYVCSFGLPAVTVRPFNTYGPRQSARAIIPSIISQALHSPEIRLGNLTTTRDLTFVTDTCDGLLRAGLVPDIDGLICNLGVGKRIAIGDLAKLILERMNLEKPIVLSSDRLRPEGSEVLDLESDNRLARERLAWTPQISLSDGIDRVISFLRTQPALADASRYAV
ncbi:MAG: SDR family NAD(P)-dependent oxidoreductase [Chthoniobacterales bacterium]